MGAYNLEPGEFIIMEKGDERIKLASTGWLDALALTNQCLILAIDQPRGLFSSTRMLKRCPLDAIACHNDVPQVALTKRVDKTILNISFKDELVSLLFESQDIPSAKRWANAIRNAAVGNLDCGSEDHPRPGSVAYIAETIRETFGIDAAQASSAPIPSPIKKSAARTAVGICKGCHAPIQGVSGKAATCDWCGTTQFIKE